VALLAAVRDHFQKLMSDLKSKSPAKRGRSKIDAQGEAVFG
jgi:hypothetical protein